MEFFNPVPSLQFMAAARVASGVIYSPEVDRMIQQERNLPLSTEIFDSRRFEQWEAIQEHAKSLLPSYCPALLRKTVSKFLRPMDFEHFTWFHTHDFEPEEEKELKSCLSWHTNGTIDRIETTKNIARNENLDLGTRFVVSCTHFLEGEILVLYDKILALKRDFILQKGNAATRFWVKMLADGTVSSWKQLAPGFFDESAIQPNDSLLRLSSFFDYLSPNYRKLYFHYFFEVNPLLQIDDFHLCLLKMGDKEIAEVFSEYPCFVLISTFVWPFECISLETAKRLLGKLDCSDFQYIFIMLLGMGIFRGYDHFDFRGLVVDLWNLIPNAFKEEIRRNSSLMREIQTVLDQGENSTAKSVGMALNTFLKVDPREDLL